MAEVEVNQVTAFLALTKKLGASLSRASRAVDLYLCDCGCIFLPAYDGEWYPDRYEHVGMDGMTGCAQECDCHKLPYTCDNDGNPI